MSVLWDKGDCKIKSISNPVVALRLLLSEDPNVTDITGSQVHYEKQTGKVVTALGEEILLTDLFIGENPSTQVAINEVTVALTEYLMNGRLEDEVCQCLHDLGMLLKKKNKAYGDSATHPVKVFSKLNSADSILIRLDDKLSRVMNSDTLRKNDIADIIGYLVLLCVAQGWTSFEDLYD